MAAEWDGEGMVDKALRERMRTIAIAPVGLEGRLGLPADAKGIVLFAHGSGSGRLSPRNNFVAQALRDDGLATLLFDLLTVDEARDRRNVFDIELLARPLLLATTWVRQDAETRRLPVGYFGASTLWVGVEKNPGQISLQGRIEDRLQQIGLAAETRPYSPHVKLAHLNRRRSLRAFLTENADFRPAPFEVMLQHH
jgi:hypothetical protein